MTWPQGVIAASVLLNMAFGVTRAVRDRKTTSGIATGLVFIQLGVSAGYAAVLHAGGFW